MASSGDARRRIITFLALVFLFSAVFYAAIVGAGTMQANGGAYVLGLMWSPGVAALVTTLVFQRTLKGLGWRFGNPKYLLVALALPLAYAGATYALTWLSGLGAFSLAGLPLGYDLAGFLAITLTVGWISALIGALGEEIGWRGLLVPQLARTTTFTKTALISGIIWTVWHSPILLFADYNGGTPLAYSLACFAVMVVGISFAFAWLRLASGSLWTGVLLHASHNLLIQGVFDPLTASTGPTPFMTGEFGVGLALAALVVAYAFWSKRAGVALKTSIARPVGG